MTISKMTKSKTTPILSRDWEDEKWVSLIIYGMKLAKPYKDILEKS